MKTYSELMLIDDYLERYFYLQLRSSIGVGTFGYNRHLNQMLYQSHMWKEVRNEVIIRDDGCDLGIDGYGIERPNILVVHHMNPITAEDILNGNPDIFDPEFLITVASTTHKAIHYGDSSLLITAPIIRQPGDTCPWRN